MVLAIAAFLMVGIMVGITFTVQRQRFADSVNATQSYIQQQYNESQATAIDRNADADCAGARGASNCLVLGKLVDLDKKVDDEQIMQTYNVIIDNANFDAPAYKDKNALEIINALNPRARPDNSEEFFVPWGAGLQPPTGQSTPVVDANIPVRYIAILRSPRTGELGVYRVNSTGDSVPEGSLQFVELTDKVHTCLVSAEIAAKASLEISKIASQDGVTTKFDGADCS